MTQLTEIFSEMTSSFVLTLCLCVGSVLAAETCEGENSSCMSLGKDNCALPCIMLKNNLKIYVFLTEYHIMSGAEISEMTSKLASLEAAVRQAEERLRKINDKKLKQDIQ